MFRSIPLLSAAALTALVALPAQADVSLLTSIKPLQLIAAAVQEGAGSPEVLLPPGASPHHYALRPSDIRRVREAQLFYWIGEDLETFLPRVLEGRTQPAVALQHLPGLHLRHFGEAHAAHAAEQDAHAGHDDHADHDEHAGHKAHDAHQDHDDHADHADHAEHPAKAGEADEDHHDHAHRPGALDAHLWLLPANARVIAARMAADLAAADPDNAARYQANLAAFEARLAALDERLKARLATLRDKPFFVFHEAYDYFEEAYGLRHTAAFAISSEAQPGARHVAAMRSRLEQAGASCVFTEPPQRPRLAETLGAGLDVRFAELDALGHGLPLKADAYERLLEGLATIMAECLEAL